VGPLSKSNEPRLSAEEIDRLVEAEAEDDTAWADPVFVHPPNPLSQGERGLETRHLTPLSPWERGRGVRVRERSSLSS